MQVHEAIVRLGIFPAVNEHEEMWRYSCPLVSTGNTLLAQFVVMLEYQRA